MLKNTLVYLCGGQGKRFQEVCPQKKPCQLIYHRPMYQWVIDSVLQNLEAPVPMLFIIHDDDHGRSILYHVQKQYLSTCLIDHVKIHYMTRGPVETCKLCFDQKKILRGMWILDNDILYDPLIPWNMHLDPGALYLLVQEMSPQDTLQYSSGGASPFSHVVLDRHNNVKCIREKVNISRFVVLGAYGFGSQDVFDTVFRAFIEDHGMRQGEWFMSCLVQKALELGIPVHGVISKSSVAIGTPEQVQAAIDQKKIVAKPLRWVFDLDQTLVSLPTVPGDYDSVEPIKDKIEFVRQLYEQGHYIIIHTARHMVTCNGDVKKVEERVGEVTRRTLRSFDIPYHELIFGKPYADVYVDDKSSNPNHWHPHWLTSSMGFGWNEMLPGTRVHKKVVQVNETTCLKFCSDEEAKGLVHFVKHCPKDLLDAVPQILDVQGQRVFMEWKNDTITLGKLLAFDMLSNDIFQEALRLLQRVHACGSCDACVPVEMIQANYFPKFMQRYQQYDIYKQLGIHVNMPQMRAFFASYKPVPCPCIHGDFWLSNLLWSHKEKKVFMIDMRGRIGNEYTVGGDKRYDYGKMYQSIIGFDTWIISRRNIHPEVRYALEHAFREFFDIESEEMEMISKIACTFILGSLPFHEELWGLWPEIQKELVCIWPGILLDEDNI